MRSLSAQSLRPARQFERLRLRRRRRVGAQILSLVPSPLMLVLALQFLLVLAEFLLALSESLLAPEFVLVLAGQPRRQTWWV